MHPEQMPKKDARISFDLDDPSIHDALKQINPILQEIVRSLKDAAHDTEQPGAPAFHRISDTQFHRIMFSSCADF